MIQRDLLSPLIRSVTEENRKKLPTYSHSKLEQFENCPYCFDLKYNKGKRSDDTTIALELGTLLHYVLEQKGRMITSDSFDGVINYDTLFDIMYNGASDDGKLIPGLNTLKNKYWEIWGEDDSEGRNYTNKMDIFNKVLYYEMEDGYWEPYLFEYPFEFVYDNRIIIVGFIDRIDKHGNEYRLVDYKTSKKVFDEKKNATSQQFSIYNMALLNDFGTIAKENLYRFILIDQEQNALTNGWQARFIKKINKVLDQIDECNAGNLFKPSPTPLCAWCNYSKTNPDAHEYKHECEYHSLWTPNDRKNFSVNKVWNPEEINEPKRKLIF